MMKVVLKEEGTPTNGRQTEKLPMYTYLHSGWCTVSWFLQCLHPNNERQKICYAASLMVICSGMSEPEAVSA